MLSFDGLVTCIVGVIVAVLTIIFQYQLGKKAKEDEDNRTVYGVLKKLILIAAALILLILLLYGWNNISSWLQTLWKSFEGKPQTQPTAPLPDIAESLSKTLGFDISGFQFLPFQKGFFSNGRFAFAYILGIVFSVAILIAEGLMYAHTCAHRWYKRLIAVLYVVLSAWALIWVDYFVASRITEYLVIDSAGFFNLVAIVISFICYAWAGLILAVLALFISEEAIGNMR